MTKDLFSDSRGKGLNDNFIMASQNYLITIKIVMTFICICNIERYDAFSCERSPSKFLVEPTDVHIRRGEAATFHCSVADFNPETKSMRGEVYPDPDPSISPLIDEIYDNVNRILISNLTVQSFSMHTGTQFYISCILEESIQQQTLCFSSRLATMDVMYFPKQDDLSCGSSLNNVVHLGETLSLECRVVRGNPPVDMTWTVLPGGTIFTPSLDDEGSLRVLSHDLFITRDLHLKRIVCEVSSEFSFPGEKLQCSIGPIKVYHLPEVHIFPQTISIMSLDHVELTCTADAYPEVQNFTWTCFPEAILKGCGIISPSRHSFTFNTTGFCTSNTEGVHITCSAVNSEGMGTGYAYLDTVNICQSNYTINNETGLLSNKVDVNISLYQNLVHEDFALICAISHFPTVGLHSADFQWYLDDVLVTDRFQVKNLPSISAITLFNSLVRPESTKIFTCEATMAGMRAIASTNLSTIWKNKETTCLASFDYSGATPQSNYGNVSVNGQLSGCNSDIKVTPSVHSKQNFLDGLGSIIPFIMMVISGVVLVIAFVMIIFSLYLCRGNRKCGKDIDPSSDTKTEAPKATTSHAIHEYCTNIVDDMLYEEPNVNSQQIRSDVSATHSSSSNAEHISGTFKLNLHHEYFTAELPEIASDNVTDPQSDYYENSSLQDNDIPMYHYAV